MKSSQGFRTAAIGAAALCGLIVAGVAMARPPAKATTETAKQTREEQLATLRASLKNPENVYALSDAMRVFIDPQTGKIREPNVEEMAELGRAARRVAKAAETEPQVFDLPGGGIGVEVPDELTSYSLLRVGQDGAVAVECREGVVDEKSLEAAPATPAAAEVQ